MCDTRRRGNYYLLLLHLRHHVESFLKSLTGGRWGLGLMGGISLRSLRLIWQPEARNLWGWGTLGSYSLKIYSKAPLAREL